MTQEEKAKAYDNALEKARMSYHTGDYDRDTLEMLEIIFPELKELKDERIRESLLKYLHTLPNHYAHSGICALEWIAWLEKQGEQKLVLDKESSFVDNNVRLSLELYRDGNRFGIWLSDDFGGSGINATGNTPEEAANSIAAYIADYFYKRDDIMYKNCKNNG